jgi:anaerobic selenocysteine-containing dehydrogenase
VMLQILTGNIDVLGGGLIRMAGIKEHPYRLRQFMGDLKCTGAETHPLLHESGMVFHEGGMANWTDTILEGEPYQVKMVMINGSNPVVSWPNTRKTVKALDQLDFLVVMDPFWTPTCEHAHIVLPACTFAERISLCTIYQGMNVPAVQMRRRAIEPLHEARSDATVWLELAKRMGGDFAKHIPWTDDEELFDYWLEPSGLTAKALKEHPTGIVTGSDEIRFDYHKHGFATKSGKAELYSQELLRLGVEPLPIYREPAESPISTPELAKEYPVILTTGAREIEFWHSQQRHVPNLTKRNPEPRVEMHKDTAAQYGIADGDMVFIETRRGRAEMKAKVTDKILAGVVSTSHGWAGKGNENLLTNDVPEDPVGGLPPMAAHLCKIGKIG